VLQICTQGIGSAELSFHLLDLFARTEQPVIGIRQIKSALEPGDITKGITYEKAKKYLLIPEWNSLLLYSL
jgi:hypothetical protein